MTKTIIFQGKSLLSNLDVINDEDYATTSHNEVKVESIFGCDEDSRSWQQGIVGKSVSVSVR